MKELEPVETNICRACNVAKKLKSFQTLKSGNKCGVCNVCRATGRTIPKGTKINRKPKNIELQMGFVRKQDWEYMYKSLEKIGYSLNDENDIHEQFCNKYGLTPRSPKQTFKNHYSQKDLGLI